ncbi:DUF4294 domain-containing protein [Pedobacter sp. SYSU D00535]|uniref:DUF4294 domain-containing protein n=1 Tax=Pedobacter sp. SYSU D00535 TaxID=2810308 RepID=UPI001A976467|nr:DUF4294 domain-containing protein [Pedobacter sp. SYSU D00535]
MKFLLLFLFFTLFFGFSSQCQENFDPKLKGKNDSIRVAVTTDEYGNLVPWIPLADVNIYSTRIFQSPQARAQYNRLRYNVLKVLPYAMFARERYARLNQQLAITKDRREQKKLVKACEKEIKDMFNREIKNMTITQGEILIKLIDRETGNSTYDLVKDLKGGFTAFSYQLVAKVFGHNLKQQYDPNQERDIENIIQRYGFYSTRAALN